MKLMKCLQPAHWPRPKGYSNGIVVNGRTIYVSGMIGWNAEGKMVSGDFVGQVRQIFEIIGSHYPAMTAVQVSSLIEDSARVEIEVTAVVPE
jgi:enamine deaminase RidA (YjgF/YER057c/UK114 family)